MQAFKRELEMLLAIAGLLESLGDRVAMGAVGAGLTVVFILVAIDAMKLVGSIDLLGVAAYALAAHLGLGMEAFELVACVLVVVEGPGSLATLDVATVARFVGELPLVYIAVLVAARTFAFRIGQRRRPHVATFAVERLVLAEQGKAEVFMIDGRFVPGFTFLVAFPAVGKL